MNIRIIGCGAMGSAIAENLSEQGRKISLYDRSYDKAKELAYATGQTACRAPLEDLGEEDMLILAVKPWDFKEGKKELQGFIGKFAVSFMTGISMNEIKEAFPLSYPIRMMTNLAIRYGDGTVVIAEDPALESIKRQIDEIFSSFGAVKWIPESQFDAATSLIGSGPAFVFTLVEAMVDSAIALGFTADMGFELVKSMIGGSLTMLYESQSIPCQLKWKVASPAGTTIAGIKALEDKGVRSAIIEAFLAAYKRAKELG